MKRKHLLLTLLVSLAMILSMIPATAFASDPVDITISTIYGIPSSVTYTGKVIKPEPTTVFWEGLNLEKGTDYTLSYKNNKNVGLATVFIKGKVQYGGTIEKQFKIIPKGTSISKASRSYNYIKLVWKKQAAKMAKSRISGYQVRYSANKDMSGSKSKKIKGYSKTAAKFKGLTAGTKYYFQIRTYKVVGKKTYYSKWSGQKAFTTKGSTPDKYVYGCVKVGNYVYCEANGNIYKVNVKTNKKTLFKKTGASNVGSMAIRGGYLYYIADKYNDDGQYPLKLCKVSLSTKKASMVVPAIDYYFESGRIVYASYSSYADWTDSDGITYYEHKAGNWMSMALDGSGKRDLNRFGYKYRGKYKACNSKGYSEIRKFNSSGEKANVYLKKPNKKKIYLAKEWSLMGVPHTWLEDDEYY